MPSGCFILSYLSLQQIKYLWTIDELTFQINGLFVFFLNSIIF